MIRYVSKRLKNEEKFILKCTEIDIYSLYYASDRLKRDPNYVIRIV
jgi:hypothetical protein